MLVPEAQHQSAHLESAPPSCETAGSKLPASASDTPSYPKRGWGSPPPLLFSSTLLSSSRGDAGLRQRRREAGQSRRPGRAPPSPPGRRRGNAGAEGRPHRSRCGVSGVQRGLWERGKEAGSHCPRGLEGQR